VINLINADLPPLGRLSGQNGEILRGFYYPGQPLARPPSPALAENVVDWRILSNDVVDPALFDAQWLADSRAALRQRLVGLLLAGGEPDWASALDRFYLEQRMQRWCGTSVSATLGRRPVLLPFFDADVLALSAATTGAEKSGSRLVARLIAAANPALAAIPLENGATPASVAGGGLGASVASARRFVKKATAKLRQRLSGADRATFGSASTLELIARQGLAARVDIHRLSSLGIFNHERLEAFGGGRWQPSRSTTGFLYTSHFLLERLEQ
jgi:asparagine synthase (glutamine-hydrolysing)